MGLLINDARPLTQREFDDLLEYSTSLPTGTTPGKAWKRRVPFNAPADRADWWRGTYGLPYPEGHEHHGQIPIGWRRIHIIGRPASFPFGVDVPPPAMRGRMIDAPFGTEDGALCLRTAPGYGPCLERVVFDDRWDGYPNRAGHEVDVICPGCGWSKLEERRS